MVTQTLTQTPTGRPSREVIKTHRIAEEAAHHILLLRPGAVPIQQRRPGQAPPPAAREVIPFHPGEAQAADHIHQDLHIAQEAADLHTAADHREDQYPGAVAAVPTHRALLQGPLHREVLHQVLHQEAAEGNKEVFLIPFITTDFYTF